MSKWEQTGDGAVYTTVEDLLRWDNNFYDPNVGGRKLLVELHRTGALAIGSPLTYASGLIVSPFRGLRSVSHGGAWGVFSAELVRFPDGKLSVVALSNEAKAGAGGQGRAGAAGSVAGGRHRRAQKDRHAPSRKTFPRI